ncbi:NAD-dependent epimerase/dehydratase family protein [Alteromonas sp. CYL-A6]|uniref:NAD-dependent epimerase/dehydratase family protein n=1 Tax=Alteromonas nitratireducens TaxID=3390813 RepID=UPI0034B1C856
MAQAKRILVTGSLGYIGSRLVPYLVEHGYAVTAVDTGFFRDCLLYPEASRGDFTYLDVRDLDREALNNVDALIHLAGISNDPFGDLMPEQVYDSSTRYSVELARWCKELGVRYVFASSCSIYGSATEPVVTESSVPNPQTFYSHNKLDIENEVGAMADGCFQPVFLRFSTLFGPSPRMRFDIVVNMLTAMAFANRAIILNSDGMANRPFVHIEDVCQSFRCALEAPLQGDQPVIVNIGSDSENYRIIDIARMICEMAGNCELRSLADVSSDKDRELFKDRKLQDGVDSRDYRVSFDHLKTVFPDFTPRWTLRAGIEELFALFDRLSLTEAMYKSPQYYRLQTMDALYTGGRIDDNLRWR